MNVWNWKNDPLGMTVITLVPNQEFKDGNKNFPEFLCSFRMFFFVLGGYIRSAGGLLPARCRGVMQCRGTNPNSPSLPSPVFCYSLSFL